MTSTLQEHGIQLLPEREESQPYLALLAAHSVNLRDLGSVAPLLFRSGIAYRSSQIVSPSHLNSLGIKKVVDLRQAPLACSTQVRNVRQTMGRGLSQCAMWCKHRLLLQSRKVHMDPWHWLYAEHELDVAPPCYRCSEACRASYGCDAEVYHIDLLPTPVPFIIFRQLPTSLQIKVVCLKIRRKHPEPLVAAAVADPRVMGYFKLYKIILDHAKARVAQALRSFLAAAPDCPVLAHCMHGKDRTGLIVMLLYLLVGVPRAVIVQDYSHSESLLKEGRDNRRLLGMDESVTTDEIMAAAASVMEATIDHVLGGYGSVEGYMASTGMQDEEIRALRAALRQPPCD